MQVKPRILVASQPGAWLILKPMLEEGLELVRVHAMGEALRILDNDPASIAVVLSTIAFDDSRMIDFLYAAKSTPRASNIPFICCRILPTVLSQDAVARVAEVCALGGAAEFIDFPSLNAKEAVARFRATVMRHIGENK